MKMDSFPSNVLVNFHPFLQQNFKELFYHGKIGLSQFTINDIALTKQYHVNGCTYAYQCVLKIPYAGKRLHWDLIFNPEDITFAPDFNFNDDSFHMSHDLAVVIDNIPSLIHWNIENSKSLLSVLNEFLNLYKKQQLQKLQNENIYTRLSTEYEALLADEVVSAEDVEVCLENTVAHFLVNIKVDMSNLPKYIQPKMDCKSDTLNPGEDTSILKVSFVKLDGSRVTTSLQLSARMEQVLGNSKTLHIPMYNKQTSLAGYVSLVSKLLNDHIHQIELNNKMKREYMGLLNTLLSTHIIEFDSDTFLKSVLLCEIDGYYCLVHIEIGDGFPKDKPSVTLHSMYCVSGKKPCVDVVDNYPYSPRWSPEMMIRKLLKKLEEIIPVFKSHKHRLV